MGGAIEEGEERKGLRKDKRESGECSTTQEGKGEEKGEVNGGINEGERDAKIMES